jgi:hypothetical protein
VEVSQEGWRRNRKAIAQREGLVWSKEDETKGQGNGYLYILRGLVRAAVDISVLF